LNKFELFDVLYFRTEGFDLL